MNKNISIILILLISICSCTKENPADKCSLKATAKSNSPIISGGTIELEGNATEDKYYTNWEFQWDGPNNFRSEKQNEEIVGAGTEAAGTYTLTVTSDHCRAESKVDVVVDSVPPPCNIADNTAILSSGLPQMHFITGCRIDAAFNAWLMDGGDKNGQLVILFNRESPPIGSKVYNIVGNSKPLSNFKSNEVQVRMLVGFGSAYYYGQSGKLYLEMKDGNFSATFCDIEFLNTYGMKFTAKGNLVCMN